MQLDTTEDIITYYLKNINEILTKTYKEPELTQEEAILIVDQLPDELLYPDSSIRGNPSPISSMKRFYGTIKSTVSVAAYILHRRNPKRYPLDKSRLIVLDLDRHLQGTDVNIDPQNPIASLVLTGLMQQQLTDFGNPFIVGEQQSRSYNNLVEEYFLYSHLLKSGKIQDLHDAYALLTEIAYITDYAKVMDAFGSNLDDVPTLLDVSNIFYDPDNQDYNGFGPLLDERRINWRTLDKLKESKGTYTQEDVIAIVQDALNDDDDDE